MLVADIKEMLKDTMGKKETDLLSQVLLNQPKDFKTVFSWIFSHDKKIAWHAAWIIEKIVIKDNNYLNNKQKQNLINLTLTNQHQGLQRLILSILYHSSMEKPIAIAFVDKCMEQMIDYKCPTAIQVLSMKLLYNICKIEPGFVPELVAYLENCDEENYSAGFNTAKRNILSSLNSSATIYLK